MSLLNKESIYESPSQRMDHIDPSKIRLSGDRVLIRDIPEDERRGLIWVPEVCQDQEMLRQGIVVAVGPGDRYVERVASQNTFDSDGRVPVRRKATECDWCCGRGRAFSISKYENETCPRCNGDGLAHLPMSVRPGQRVLYSRRREAEIFIEGERYALVHLEQSIMAILEED